MKKILLISLSLLFAGEMEVDGNLKVNGQIDASNQRVKNVGPPTDMMDAINAQTLQDILRNDGTYQYKFILASFSGSNSNYDDVFSSKYKELGNNNYNSNFENKIDELSALGWVVSARFSTATEVQGCGECLNIIYEFKRLIEE